MRIENLKSKNKSLERDKRFSEEGIFRPKEAREFGKILENLKIRSESFEKK